MRIELTRESNKGHLIKFNVNIDYYSITNFQAGVYIDNLMLEDGFYVKETYGEIMALIEAAKNPPVATKVSEPIVKKKTTGMTFTEMLPHLLAGKKVRRQIWKKYTYIYKNEDDVLIYSIDWPTVKNYFPISDFEATDWEI